MRLWLGIPVYYLCDQHLLGEHSECHMFIGSILRGISIQGYIDRGLVEPWAIEERHDLLAAAMQYRWGGWKEDAHHSELSMKQIACTRQPKWEHIKLTDEQKAANFVTLMNRCANCRALIRYWCQESPEALAAQQEEVAE